MATSGGEGAAGVVPDSATLPTSTTIPHAFHQHLPPHHMDPATGTPWITQFAHKKSKQVLELAHSIQLSEALFIQPEPEGVRMMEEEEEAQAEAIEDMEDDDDEDDEDLEDENGPDEAMEGASSSPTHPHHPHHHEKETLNTVLKKCARLQSKLSTLEGLKHTGVSQLELCRVILHLLRLVTCTVTYHDLDEAQEKEPQKAAGSAENGADAGVPPRRRRRVELHYENVGCLYSGPDDEPEEEVAQTAEELEADLSRDFALPSPCRELLLTILVSLLSNKGPLRSVSNASLYPAEQSMETEADTETTEQASQEQRHLLILQWKVLLRMLLRTAPHLDEHKVTKTQVDSNSRNSTVVKRTVQLIRDARHFFDQGVRPGCPDGVDDRAARGVWDMVKTDILYHVHSHACYRGTILLYLFHPSRCTAFYYQEVLPVWLKCWTSIDRCPEYDFLWLTLFCRARKHVSPDDYDWSLIRRRLLTHSQYWLQLPIGGAALDKSFPGAANPRSRSCPPRLKAFAGAGSSYEEGIDFVAKVAKLLVAGLGTGDLVEDTTNDVATEQTISSGTYDMLRFLKFVTPYFNPSNLGSWTFTLGAFLHYFAYELCCRIGAGAGRKTLKQSHPALHAALEQVQPGSATQAIPPHEIVAVLDACLPLCQQALYSKNGHVGRAGEAAMLYLVQIDPVHASPCFIDFATRALGVSAVNLAHQAPAALSALTRLIQPALRSDPTILLSRLPDMLSLSLAGIDSNDQNKSIRTLILYRNLTSWVPVGGRPESWASLPAASSDQPMIGRNGTMRVGNDLFGILSETTSSSEYLLALSQLPATSLLRQGVPNEEADAEMRNLVIEEASSAMSDWALEFLERIFGLLRASGEREKAGKTSGGVANRHSTADVHQARNFSRVLKECLVQVFSAMDDDVHALALRSVVRFLEEETLPTAAKDASLLCQATAAARLNKDGDMCSPGLDALVSVLAGDLSHHSTKTATYRLRCLAGSVRLAGVGVVKNRSVISGAIDFALSSEDRHLFKTGCKLLRHTLSALCESYAVSSDCRPRGFADASKTTCCLGKCSQLSDDPIRWHVPTDASIEFACDLLNTHVSKRLDSFCSNADGDQSRLFGALNIIELRRCLRVIRYSLRGGASALLDYTGEETLSLVGSDNVPYERAVIQLLGTIPEQKRDSLLRLRGRICSFVVSLYLAIASETLYHNAVQELPESDISYRKTLQAISSDPKVCKETCDIALLVLTRRGASFRSQENRTIWKAQKQMATNFALCAQVDFIVESLQFASMYGVDAMALYKDGEDAGKTVPRRLLVARMQLFHDQLQRLASFEVPRRLRRFDRRSNLPHNILFNAKHSLSNLIESMEQLQVSQSSRPLDGYEGLIDGLFALCCHSNTKVRASAVSVVDYGLTRFAWLVRMRIPRLMSGIEMKDAELNGKFGLPSCAKLIDIVDHQGKRKRLADAIKGCCSVLALPRAGKIVLGTAEMRFRFAKLVCGTDSLMSLLPAEEMQKMVYYLHALFSQFRSKIYFEPRASPSAHESHVACILFCLDVLSERPAVTDADDESEKQKAAHWRKLLTACWFVLVSLDGEDIKLELVSSRAWTTCFRILENETGQPLQRVALGLFGRLLSLTEENGDKPRQLEEKMTMESFSKTLANALVYDHREDTSVGGGHRAQWSTGVEDIIRDASRNVAPRSLFPFQRTSQSSGSFKVSHAQLLERMLLSVGEELASTTSNRLLAFARELADAPPSEDQKNQHITSAEIFAGVCGSFLRRPGEVASSGWKDIFLPQLDDVMSKIPFSQSGAYFDAIRYALQFIHPDSFLPLTTWLIERIESTLWQPETSNGGAEVKDVELTSSGSLHGTEGFTAQSKWLYLFSAVLIELDEKDIDQATLGWYSPSLTTDTSVMDVVASESAQEELERTWELVSSRLLPRLTEALGHPFDSCRDHVSRCLFRICYCHRKRARLALSRSNSMNLLSKAAAEKEKDPGTIIVNKLTSLENREGWSFNQRYNALSTARRFISYCVHLGEAKFEYSDFVIPLLPTVFETLESTVEDYIAESSPEESAAMRALEAEVIKSYRYMVADVSTTAIISYGRDFDISRVLDVVEKALKHEGWQVRHAGANFLRIFQGAHRFLFSADHEHRTMAMVTELLADERREVSSAAMAALTGILAAYPVTLVSQLVKKHAEIADKSKLKRKKKLPENESDLSEAQLNAMEAKKRKRARNQQISVFFLCASVMAQPYETPHYIPVALAAISKHSFERNAPLGVREIVKKCCAEYKKTHMSDNWDVHRSVFTHEQLEAFEDVVSTPHYYA